MRIVFWGAGRFWAEHQMEVENLRHNCRDEWIGIFDIDEKKEGREVYGLKVGLPKKMGNTAYVITCQFVDEVKQLLFNEYGVDENYVSDFWEYQRRILSRNKYLSLYGSDICKTSKFNKSKMAVYTCIAGDYDILHEPMNYNSKLDYICFTNNTKMKSDIWDIRMVSKQNLDNVHLARYVKLFPHIFLKDYETSIWIDAKYLIKDDLLQYVLEYEKTKDMLCFPHPERDCIYDEVVACKNAKVGIVADMDRQLQNYRDKGYGKHCGLYDTGCIVRNHKVIEIQKIMDDWWNEIKEYSYRDQLSFPYVLQKNNYVPDICDLDINNNRWLKMVRKL